MVPAGSAAFPAPKKTKMAASRTLPTRAARSLADRKFERSSARAKVGLIMIVSPIDGWIARRADGSGGEALDFDEGALQRRVALLGADGEPIRVDEFRLDADKVEHALEVGLEMFERRGRRAFAVEAAAGQRDDDALVLDQTLRSA